jgi:hypothetical protein
VRRVRGEVFADRCTTLGADARIISEDDEAYGVATDGDGNVYIAGVTGVWVGIDDEMPHLDAFVAKYSARP